MHAPTMAQPIMNHHTVWSGTYYSFASDEPCAHFLDYHPYLTHLYLPRLPEYKFPPVFRFSVFTSPCTFTLHPTVLTCYTTPGDDPSPPDHTLRAT